MTRDDVESLDLPAGNDVTRAAAAADDDDDAGVPATRTQHLGSLTSHDLIASTLPVPANAFAIHGDAVSFAFEQ